MQYKLVLPIRVLIVSVIVSIGLLLALPASAQVTVTDGNIAATFSSAPLFSAPTTANLAPAATQTGTITVVNNGADTESVLLAAVATSSTGLAEAVELVVTEGGLVRYTGTFAAFFSNASVPLSDLAPGANSTYTLTANFLSGSGNQYQGTVMAFDLKIGFASGAGVTGPTGGGGGSTTGTLINPPTPGNSNSPDGIVAGVATDNGNGLWPLWDTLMAAISNAVAPDRNASGANKLSTSTQDTVFEPEGVADEYPAGLVAGIVDESVLGKVCILLWFLLLVLLGLLGRSALQFTSSTQVQIDIDKLRLTYLLVTAGYVIALFIVHLLTGITLLWSWLLFAVWVLYQGYDFGIIWQQTGLFSRLRIAVLLVGVMALFILPTYVSWLCPWW
jgi:hypothetical protein